MATQLLAHILQTHRAESYERQTSIPQSKQQSYDSDYARTVSIQIKLAHTVYAQAEQWHYT
jgi:hypothetical protein